MLYPARLRIDLLILLLGDRDDVPLLSNTMNLELVVP
jgi:hypothetical protein